MTPEGLKTVDVEESEVQLSSGEAQLRQLCAALGSPQELSRSSMFS